MRKAKSIGRQEVPKPAMGLYTYAQLGQRVNAAKNTVEAYFKGRQGQKRAKKTTAKKSRARSRGTIQQRSLELFRKSVLVSKKIGVEPSANLFDELEVMHRPFFEFIVEREGSDEDLVLTAVLGALENQKEKAGTRESYKRFQEIFGDLNDRSLGRAAQEEPDLLPKLMNDEKLRPLTRANILQEIGALVRESDFGFIESFIGHDSPFIREAALRSLFDFYDPVRHPARSERVKALLDQRAAVEIAKGVKTQIQSLQEMLSLADLEVGD